MSLTTNLERRSALRVKRTELCSRLLTEPMPEAERKEWQRALVEMDVELAAVEEAIAAPLPAVEVDPAAKARAERIAAIRGTKGFIVPVDGNGERLIGYEERARLQSELQMLELGVPSNGTGG